MATKLRGLALDEFSIVRGADKQPANPEAVATLYKAETKETDMAVQKTETKTPATDPSLRSRVLRALGIEEPAAEVEKAQVEKAQTRTYNYTSTGTETFDDGSAAGSNNEATVSQDGGTTTIVITEGAVGKTMAAPATASEPEDIVKALTQTAGELRKVTESMAQFENRLAKVEGTPIGSRAISKSIQVGDSGGVQFPAFTKALSDRLNLSPGQRLNKATITSSGWSVGLALKEADMFIDYVVNEAVVLKVVRVVKMPDKKYNIDKIGIGDPVLVKGVPGVDPGDTVTVTGPTQVQLDSEEVIGIVSIGDDTLEDNIEGDAFVQHLLTMIGNKAANQIDEMSIHGDTAVASTGILDRADGFYKRAKAGGANVIEAMADADRYWPGANGAKMTRLLKRLPTKYRQDNRKLGLFLHNDLYLDYNEELASKGFSEAWQAITGTVDVPIKQVPNIVVPLMKTNMSFTYSATPYTNGTFAMLTNPKNLIVGFHREIRIESQRQARKRATDYVITARLAVQIENPEAIAIYDHALVR
jgi:hypothetical protein